METNQSTNGSSILLFNTTKPTSALHPSAVISWLSVYMTQCYAGALGNLSVACLILFTPRLRTGCGLLIAHSLIAHTALCAISFPLTGIPVYGKLIKNWTVEFRYCNTAMWSQLASRYASNWIEAFIAANRFVALCFPFQYRKFSKAKLENTVMVILWILAASLAGLGAFGVGIQYFVLPVGSCGVAQKSIVGLLTIVTGNYVPLAVAAAGYCVIYLKMLAKKRRNNAIFHQNNQNAETRAERKRLSKANMVFVAFFWNSLCYMVWPVTLTMFPHIVQIPMVPLIFANVQIMGYVTNPLVFILMSADYRNAVRAIFGAPQKNVSHIGSNTASGQKTGQVPRANNSRLTGSTGGV